MTEIENKFRSSREALSPLIDLTGLPPDYVFEKAFRLEIHDVYFDTEDHLLLKQGASLRRRKKGNILKVTLKTHPLTEGAGIIHCIRRLKALNRKKLEIADVNAELRVEILDG